MSLARSFVVAGAASVMMSLWNVQDQSTAILMERFYEKLRAGASAPQALREAKLAFLREGRGSLDGHLAHPWFWAPFVILDTHSG